MMKFPVVQIKQMLNCVFFHYFEFVNIYVSSHENVGLVIIFRIFRVLTTDKVNNVLHRIKQNDHILYLYLVVFVLTFICYLSFSGILCENDYRFVYIYILINKSQMSGETAQPLSLCIFSLLLQILSFNGNTRMFLITTQ